MSEQREALAEALIKAFGGYNDLEFARLERQERVWLIDKGRRAAAVMEDALADAEQRGADRVAAAVEALAEEATERAYLGIALEKVLTVQTNGPDRAKVPSHWREAAEFAAFVSVVDLRAALTPGAADRVHNHVASKQCAEDCPSGHPSTWSVGDEHRFSPAKDVDR